MKKTNKMKLLLTGLSVVGLATVAAPTFALTSCSAAANPFLTELKSRVNGLDIEFKKTISKQPLIDAKFVMNFEDMKQTSLTYKEQSSSSDKILKFDNVTNAWKKLQEKYTELPAISEINDQNFTQDKPFYNEALIIMQQSDYFVSLNSIIVNLKDIVNNFINLIFQKNPIFTSGTNPIFKDIFGEDTNDFRTSVQQGINDNGFYARLWLSNIDFDMSSISLEAPGTKLNNEKNEYETSISNITLTFNWFESLKYGSKILTATDLANYKINNKPVKESFKFTLKNFKYYFDLMFNSKKDSSNNQNNTNYYSNGQLKTSINPISLPFSNSINFVNNEETKKITDREKTNWFNNEILNLTSKKIVSESEIITFLQQIGYLTKSSDLNVENAKPNDQEAGLKFLKELINTKKDSASPQP